MSFLKKYKPTHYKDFIIDDEYINLLNTLQNMDNLNILFIGEQGVGKTSLITATINEYYNTTKPSKYDVLYINSLKEQGINYYRNNLKTFCQTKCSNPLKKKFIIIDISKKKLFKKEKNAFCLSIGQLGKCISILKENSCKKIIFAGRVERPNFSRIKFDFKALYHLPKIIKETKKGDAYIITFITKLFEKEGFKIISKEPKKGADNKLVAFLHPKSTNGVLIELCQEIEKK